MSTCSRVHRNWAVVGNGLYGDQPAGADSAAAQHRRAVSQRGDDTDLALCLQQKELRSADVEAIDRLMKGSCCGRIIRRRRFVGPALYNLGGSRACAGCLAEDAIQQLPRRYFPDEHRMIESWRQHPPRRANLGRSLVSNAAPGTRRGRCTASGAGTVSARSVRGGRFRRCLGGSFWRLGS